jgi:hypothetical protein
MLRSFGLILVVASVAIARPPEPVPTTSEAGRFTVTFPAKPSQTEKDIVTDAGTLKVTTLKAETGGVQYAVSFTDYPNSFRQTSAKDILDAAAKAMAGDSAGSVKEFTQEGVPGRTLTLGGGDNEVKARLFLDGQRLYVVVACGTQKAMKGSSADSFVGGFSLSK